MESRSWYEQQRMMGRVMEEYATPKQVLDQERSAYSRLTENRKERRAQAAVDRRNSKHKERV